MWIYLRIDIWKPNWNWWLLNDNFSVESFNKLNDLEKLYPKLRVYKPRLPRLETEQTLSLIKINNIKTEKLILDSLQKFSKL